MVEPRQLVLKRWKIRGLVVSALAHLVLILLLGVITLKLPSQAASLALESAPVEVSEPTMEMSSPREVAEPEVDSPAESTAEASLDVVESFEGLEVSLTDSLSGLADTRSQVTSLAAMTGLAASGTGIPNPSGASFYGASASGNCFCFVIDGSGSMRGGPWDAAKGELMRSIAGMKREQRFYIIFYNRELSAIPLPGERTPSPRALYATPENIEHAQRWLEVQRIGIGAPPDDALQFAIDKEPDAIYLLTDGDTTMDVARFLREINRVDDLLGNPQILVPIHTIAFYSSKGQQLLRSIAQENRGQYIYVPDPRKGIGR